MNDFLWCNTQDAFNYNEDFKVYEEGEHIEVKYLFSNKNWKADYVEVYRPFS